MSIVALKRTLSYSVYFNPYHTFRRPYLKKTTFTAEQLQKPLAKHTSYWRRQERRPFARGQPVPRFGRLASVEYLPLQTYFCLNLGHVHFGHDLLCQVILNVESLPTRCKSFLPIPREHYFRAALIPHQMCLLQELNLLLVCGALF